MSIFLGATINDEHTLRDWKAAITNADVISVPEANTVILEVPGRNGNLDLSEALTGDVTYRNREIKLELASSVNLQTWYQKCLHIFNTYHGKTVTIIFDDDSTHYYTGRASVSDPQRVRNGGGCIFTVNADPFRYSITEKIVTAAVSSSVSSATKTITNSGRMPVCPTITASEACQMVTGGITYSLLQGTQTIPAFILPEGDTTVQLTITGGGTVSFTFREGWL